MDERRQYKRHIFPFEDYFKEFKKGLKREALLKEKLSVRTGLKTNTSLQRRRLNNRRKMTKDELKNIGLTPIEEMFTEDFGEIGTPQREEFELSCDAFILGEKLREERLRAGITQQELANRIGTKKSFISRVENGHTDVQVSTLSRIFQGLGRRVALSLL